MVICWKFSCIDCSFERICYFSIQDLCHSFHSGHSTTFQKFTQICFIWNLYFASLKCSFPFFCWLIFFSSKISKEVVRGVRPFVTSFAMHMNFGVGFLGLPIPPPVIPSITRGGETAAWQRMESWLDSGLHRYKHTFRRLQGEMWGVIWVCAAVDGREEKRLFSHFHPFWGMKMSSF